MNATASTTLQRNLIWLRGKVPSLASQLDENIISNFSLRSNSTQSSDSDLFFFEERVLEACENSLSNLFESQLSRTDGVAMPRPLATRSNSLSQKPASILSEMIGEHHEVLFDYLPIVPKPGSEELTTKPPYRNLLVLGSLMLVPLISYLRSESPACWISITLVEDDPRQLAAALSLVNLEEFVDICKSQDISLTLHVDQSKANLQDRLYTQLSLDNPTVLYGWQILRSPVKSPALMELHSWLHAPEGAAQHVLGLLGFATDEINQTQQALWNALSQSPMKVLSEGHLDSDVPVVLVASGPSLDDQLAWLSKNQLHLNIVAAGSSLGSLLRAGVRPQSAVFLERGAEVYADLCDLLADGYDLDGITAIVSSTIDPRVPQIFSSSVFYHRPVAAASCLFSDSKASTLPICGPHVINAALESILSLGSRKVLLVGTDFSAKRRTSPRAKGALGESPRELTIPVRGSHGRTVFSEPELLHTGYLLNRIVESTSDCKVYRLGEGIILSAVETVQLSEDLLDTFTVTPGQLSGALKTLPSTSFHRDECMKFFDLIKTDLDHLIENLTKDLLISDCLSRSLSISFSQLVQRLNEHDSPQRQMITRILCQPLFFCGMAIYDDPVTNGTYDTTKKSVLKSLHIIKDVVSIWLSLMEQWLVAQQLPLWDPEWLSSRCSRMEAP